MPNRICPRESRKSAPKSPLHHVLGGTKYTQQKSVQEQAAFALLKQTSAGTTVANVKCSVKLGETGPVLTVNDPKPSRMAENHTSTATSRAVMDSPTETTLIC